MNVDDYQSDCAVHWLYYSYDYQQLPMLEHIDYGFKADLSAGTSCQHQTGAPLANQTI